MGAVDTTYTFTATDTITSAKMNNIIDQTTMTTDAIIGNTLEVASGKLKVRAAGITSNEMASASVTQTALALNVATTGPAFHVNMGGTNQSLPNTGVNQTIQFDNEVFDTGSCFNTSNYRFTPNAAGYYQINLSVQIDNNGNGFIPFFIASIRKNGSIYYDIMHISAISNVLYSHIGSGSVLIYMNGSTDYIDASAAVNFASSTSPVIIGSTARTFMSGFLARSA